MKHLQDLHVLVLGLGASGLAMARWCARHGAHVTVADTRADPPQREQLHDDVPSAVFVSGPFSPALVEGTPIRAVYRSPGLSPAAVAPVTDVAKAMGLPVGGELDLFAQALADLRVVEGTAQSTAQDSVTALDVLAGERAQPIETIAGEVPEALELQAPVALGALGEEELPAVPAEMPESFRGYSPAVLAITGTNGKTTVTALTGQLVVRAGKTVAVAGNIGPTLLDTLAGHIDAGTLPEVWVLELSSFQLDGVQSFEPTAATVLNLTQDHLDWHGDMATYSAAKARVFGTQGLMVLNRDDAAVMAMLPAPTKMRLQRPQQRAHITFGADVPQRPGDYGIERVNGMTWLVRALEADETQKRKRGVVHEEEIFLQRLLPADALRIHGQHNALNALAALALASAAGCQLAPMLYGLREYRGEPHRVASVAIIDDVEYFDDSKGTNVGATVAALNGLGTQRKLVVILGGDGKGQDFAPLAPAVRQFARAVVLIGRDARAIEAVLAPTGIALAHATSMAHAVTTAAQQARAGDAVLLSPACASFDMFQNYGHRATAFCDAVQSLVEDRTTAAHEEASP